MNPYDGSYDVLRDRLSFDLNLFLVQKRLNFLNDDRVANILKLGHPH